MITFKVNSEMYGQTDCVITDPSRTLKTGWAPCGSGEDYKLTPEELDQLKRIQAGEKIQFVRETVSRTQILKTLREHPLVKLTEKPLRIFVVGSHAKGSPRPDSDIDILIEVNPRTYPVETLEEKYRNKIRRHFMKNKIMGKADQVHPQHNGRRIDLYFTYNANENSPKIEIL